MNAVLENISDKGKNRLYLLLWGGTALFLAVILTAGALKGPSVNHVFFNGINLHSSDASSETINELLLSAGELSIAEKKSFINLYLKPGEPDASPGSATGASEGRSDVYRQILNRKVNNLKAKSSHDDFTVKPIPTN